MLTHLIGTVNRVSNTGLPLRQAHRALARTLSRRKQRRPGASALEFALILPVFLLLILGMFELGRAVMVMQALTFAAREGCRVAILDGSTSASVATKVNAALTGANINLPSANIAINPSNPSSAGYDEPVTVTVQVDYGDVSWFPAEYFTNTNTVLKASITMRRETVK